MNHAAFNNFLFFRHIKRMLISWVSTPSNSEVKLHFFLKNIWLGNIFQSLQKKHDLDLCLRTVYAVLLFGICHGTRIIPNLYEIKTRFTLEVINWEVNYKNCHGYCFTGLDWMDNCICSYYSHAGSSCLFFELFRVLWGLWPGFKGKWEINWYKKLVFSY